MKTQAIIKKGIAVLLCILTLLTALASCKDGEDLPTGNTTPADTTEPPAEEVFFDIVKNGVCEYEIVYPKGCEEYVSSATTNLREKFRRSAGITINITNDTRVDGKPEKKILIGKTKFEESQKVFSDLKYHDYKIIVDGSNIILAAYNASGYTKLIEYIEENVLAKAENTAEGKNIKMKAENYVPEITKNYTISSWKILGNELSKYKIVYADRDLDTVIAAFRDDIAKKCGYVLDMALDTSCDPSDHEILIGDTNREESKAIPTPKALTYCAKISGTKLVIKSGGEHSLPKIFSSLLYNFIKGKTEVVVEKDFVLEGDLFDDTLDSSKPADSDLRIMSCNILAEFESWTANAALNPFLPVSIRKEILYAALDYYQPTVVGFQEMTMNWYAAAEEYPEYAEKWEILKFKNPQRTDGEYVFSTVMYRKDLYTLVESGVQHYSKHNNARCRCYTWAILKDKTTGQEFCFVSTHWDGSGRENGFLQVGELTAFVNEMKKRCPVFTTGDFNANEITDEFKKYIADADILDAKYAAVTQMNNVGSWHNFTKDDLSWGSCDHITATKDTTVLKYQTLYKNEIIYGSDHCWLIADVKFN